MTTARPPVSCGAQYVWSPAAVVCRGRRCGDAGRCPRGRQSPRRWPTPTPPPSSAPSPGVVFIEARAKVEVALIEHRQAGDSFGVHIGIVQSTWNPVLATASGFVVDPTGAIVTTGAITRSRTWTGREIFAVNQAFHKRYGDAAPLPKNPFTRHHVGGSGDPTTSGCRRATRRTSPTTPVGASCACRLDYVVYPYVTSQQRYGSCTPRCSPAPPRTWRSSGSAGPTACRRWPSALHRRGARRWRCLASPASPARAARCWRSTSTWPPGRQVTSRRPGSTPRTLATQRTLAAGAGPGHGGRAGLAERGQVIGLLAAAAAPGSAAPTSGRASPPCCRFWTKAGVTPHGGPVDTSFEAAMHLFKNGGYAASIPGFTKALELFPGHFRAQTNLAIAKQRAGASKGAAAPATPVHEQMSSATGVPWLLIAGVAAVLLLVAVALLLRCAAGGEAALPAWARPGRETGRAGPRAPAHAGGSGRCLRPDGAAGRNAEAPSPARGRTNAAPRRPAPASAARPVPTPMRVPHRHSRAGKGASRPHRCSRHPQPRSLAAGTAFCTVVRRPARGTAPVLWVVR